MLSYKTTTALFHPSSLADAGEKLWAKKVISLDQLTIARIEAQKTQKSVLQVLSDLKFVNAAQVAEFFQETQQVDSINLESMLLEKSIVELLPRDTAEKLKAIPIYKTGKEIAIAMADPGQLLWIDILKKTLGGSTPIKLYFAQEQSILDAIKTYYEHGVSVAHIVQELSIKDVSGYTDNPLKRLLPAILLEAMGQKASDIHFDPEEVYIRVRYRLDGVLQKAFYLHKSFWESFVVRLKVVAEMNIADSRMPQSGRFSLISRTKKFDFRVATHPTQWGESVVIRILDASIVHRLADLNFATGTEDTLKGMLQKPEGLTVVTGPTGVGKTTTLYALLRELASEQVNIMSLEQPIEYQIPLIRQTEIKETGGITFAEGIRSILRQDPDIIFIGEIRDAETAQMAFRAAMTGHRVYTTLHANTAFGVVRRLMDLGICPFMLAEKLTGVIAQRLLRSLCMTCKKERALTPAECTLLQLEGERRVYAAQGCAHCFGTGYKGRFPIAEILEGSESMEEYMTKNTQKEFLKAYAETKRFQSLRQQAVYHLLQGDTSLEEVLSNVDFG